jgi:hypothetical protein
LGLSLTTDKQKEAAWRIEFEALGEQLVYRNVQRDAIYNDEAKRQAARRWLYERDRTAQLGWLAFFVAIAGGACQHHCFVSGARLSLTPRRLPPPWSVEDLDARLSCAITAGKSSRMSITRMSRGDGRQLSCSRAMRRQRSR